MNQSQKADFTIQVSSDDENNYLIADIYYGTFSICTVDTEFGYFGISFSSDPKINYQQAFMHAPLEDFLRILELTKTELRKYPNGLHVK
jgi:hypothetical protein